MRLVSSLDNRKHYCGRLKRKPQYTEWRGLYVTGEVDGKEVDFWVNDETLSDVISFQLGDQWFYISDNKLAHAISGAMQELLKFTSVDEAPLIKTKVSARKKLGHLFTGYTPELVGDSKVAVTERRDCTVRAMMEVKGISYDEAWMELRQHRKPKRGIHMADVLRTYYSKSFKELRLDKMTLGTFAADHPTGRYIVTVSGHALAVVDGKVKDWSFKPGCRVKCVFQYMREVV